MTNEERLAFFESGELHQKVKVELLDWLGYWTEVGTSSIQSELLKAQTEQAMYITMIALDDTARKVAIMAISDSAIKSAASVEAVTDSVVNEIVTGIMSYRLEWLTGIHSLQGGE